MNIGLDEQKNRTRAEDARKGQEYRCPICDQKLELRKGSTRRHHFAHWKNSSCSDDWSSDMSEWHLAWQEQFPIDYREVVVENEGQKHRADVLIEEHKLVIEFQHSPLSPEEFQKRNDFYTKCGYHVVWLFDMSRDDQEHFVLSDAGDCYIWKKPSNTFRKEGVDIINYSGQNLYNPITDQGDTSKEDIYPTVVFPEKVSVFFERDGIIEKLLYYYISQKKVITSRIKGEMSFEWSKYTFCSWLKKNYSHKELYRPSCPDCHKPMVLRTNSFGGFLWGCQNFKDRNCRNIIDIGSTPIVVSIDNKCPFCDNALSPRIGSVSCTKCGFMVEIRTL